MASPVLPMCCWSYCSIRVASMSSQRCLHIVFDMFAIVISGLLAPEFAGRPEQRGFWLRGYAIAALVVLMRGVAAVVQAQQRGSLH